MNDKVNDLPNINGPVEETGCNTRPDEPSCDEVTDTDHVDPDFDLVESKEIPEPVNDPTKDEPDRKAPDTRTDPSHRDIPTPDHPFHVRDEIDLEPVFPLPGRKPLNKVYSPPRPSKTITK